MEKELYGKNISRRFKGYAKEVKDVWESYLFIENYMRSLHPLVKSKAVPSFSLQSLNEARGEVEYNQSRTLGFIDHVVLKVNPERSLITAVALTEKFLQDLAKTVYVAYPEKLADQNGSEDSPARLDKVINVILKSDDRDEIIDRLAEEKIRSLFYGNPADFFIRSSRYKLDFGRVFESKYSDCISTYREIIARRNIYAHNGGRIDRKYLRELGNPSLKLDSKLKISREYLRESILVLRGLSAVAARTVCARSFGLQNPRGRVSHVSRQFERDFSDS